MDYELNRARRTQGKRGNDPLINNQLKGKYAQNAHTRGSIQRQWKELRDILGSRNAVASLSRGNKGISYPSRPVSLVKSSHEVRVYLPLKLFRNSSFYLASALREFPDKSQQEIAEQVGCSQQYVAKVKDNTTGCNIPPTRTEQEISLLAIASSQSWISDIKKDNVTSDNYPTTRIDSMGRTRPTSYATGKDGENYPARGGNLYRKQQDSCPDNI
ncbi:MAG: hypothetical protein JXM72_12770 [Deltaproteobacteria bacterium]|nr:hypothetical protein [Deltaproteobacteria bacterium]